jgi:hypothetical protein
MVSRRDFSQLAAGAALLSAARAAEANRFSVARTATEWSFTTGKKYADPFNEVELDVVFRGPGGERRVPAFWAGGGEWRVRYAASEPGRYEYRTIATDASNRELHGLTGILEVAPYEGSNQLLRHGPVRVAAGARHFEHADGTPFFWLGDTWWMALCKRLEWPDEFERLTADRVEKGFTVIQIIAGLYPDMPPFDPRGANEAGFPWEKDYARINPAYFDMADLRIQHLVSRGLVPCIVGCWGYFLPWMGTEKLKKHWRNLVARWGAYPVVWCLAGEGTMPYYLSKDKPGDSALQKKGWTEIARYVRAIDGFHHPITIHPSASARNCVEDQSVLDFDMLQTGHSDRQSIPGTVRLVTAEREREPRMPVVNSEVCYEGILEASREEIQRFMFWACILSGAAGHTYGANGIWQLNRAGQPFGPSPHGRSWGDRPWDEAMRLPGSRQLGVGKTLLLQYEWRRFEPHPEWVEPRWNEKDYMLPFAAGIPGKVRILFLPTRWDPPKLKLLEPGVAYRAFLFDPRNGKRKPLGEVTGDASGDWQVPVLPAVADWVLVLER